MQRMARPVKYPGLKETIRANERRKGEDGYLQMSEIAAQFGCGLSYVWRLRNMLGVGDPVRQQSGAAATDLTETSIRPLHPGTSTKRLDDKIPSEAVLEFLKHVPDMGPTERVKVLSHLIRTGAPAIKIQAIKTLEDLSKATEQRVGPPKPLTEDERVARLSRLLLAVGEQTATKAWEATFDYTPERPKTSEGQDSSAEDSLQHDPGGSLDPSNGPAEQVQNLPESDGGT
jgi:hypothetical protein